MNKFEKKYGIKEDKKIKAFHRSRRMFCIHSDKLFIAEANLPYSHVVWFEKEEWGCGDIEELMENIVRGTIHKGNIYFYVGYDFDITLDAEFEFFKHLKELSEKLNLRPSTKIFGGLFKDVSKTNWDPKKEYGEIKNYL